MRPRSLTQVASLLTCAVALGTALSGCGLFPVAQQAGHEVSTRVRPALLVVVLDARSARARTEFRGVVIATARPGEHLLVLAADGSALGSFAAPPAPTMPVPALPKAPPRDATSFQRASYRRSLSHARMVLRHDGQVLRRRQRQDLTAWADHAVAGVLSAAGHQDDRLIALAPAISDAVTDIADLQQTGLTFGHRRVLAIIGAAGLAGSPPRLRSSLAGLTLVIADVPDAAADPAWQSDFLGARASGAFVLTPSTDDRLSHVISTCLSDAAAAVSFRVVGLHYGAAKYKLPQTAWPSLRELLRLLTVRYPQAGATINGYTDAVAVPGGNLTLSWRRARAVLIWLTGHGIAADKLTAIGHGMADPVAPNRPDGQPRNRRVVVIIGPVA